MSNSSNRKRCESHKNITEEEQKGKQVQFQFYHEGGEEGEIQKKKKMKTTNKK
jgi:hypothetical protein